jgi:hypothetical protein
MLRDEIDWFAVNRDRVSDSDWWLWVDSIAHPDAVKLAQFWMRNLNRGHLVPGVDYVRAQGIVAWYREHGDITPRQHRRLMITLRDNWFEMCAEAIT